MLRYIRRGPLRENLIIPQVRLKFMAKVFSISILSKSFDTLTKLFLYFGSEFFELFKSFRFVLHQIDISISGIVIYEGDEVKITSSCMH